MDTSLLERKKRSELRAAGLSERDITDYMEIYLESYVEGYEEAYVESSLTDIHLIAKKLRMTVQEAMDFLEIPSTKQGRHMKKLGSSMPS